MIDSHAHYDDSAFDADRGEVLAKACTSGVTHIINAASDAASLGKIDSLLAQYDILYTAAGLHPENAADLADESLEAHFQAIRSFALRSDRVVAIGEIGLDYHYATPAPDAPAEMHALAQGFQHGEEPVNWPPRSVQKDVFRRQIAMAKELGLPIVVHSRDAAEDTLVILKETGAGENGCDMHCFGYSKEMAREFLALGCYLGIGGVSTFKNGKKLKEVIACAPLERLLLETDAPYLAPEPFRGKRNESAYLTRVIAAIAEIKGISEDAVAEQTAENAKTLFSRLRG